MAPLDYSKWDKIGKEEEQDDKDDRGLERLRPDQATQRRFREHIARLRPRASEREAELFSHFIVAQDKGDKSDNCHIHVGIIQLTSECPDLLAESAVDFLAELAQEMADSRPDERVGGEAQLKRDAKLVLGALNTAAACRQFGTVAFFSQVCTPANEQAEQLN